MRILIISTFFPPLNSIASLRPYSWAKFWSQQGHEVVVLTTEKAEDPKVALRLPFEGFRVVAVPMPSFFSRLKGSAGGGGGKKGVVGRLFDYLRFKKGVFNAARMPDFADLWVGRARREAEKLGEWDLVVSTAGPYAVHLVAYALKKKGLCRRWVADYRDTWSDNYIYPGLFPFNLIEKWLERRVLAAADKVTTISEPFATGFRRRFPALEVGVVENGFDPQDLDGLDTAPAFPQDGKYRIVHTGSIYLGKRDPSPLFEAVARMAADPERQRLLDRLEVLFVGPRQANLDDLIARYHVGAWVQAVGFVSRSDALRMQRDADALLFLAWSDPSVDGVLTGKIFEYLYARTPIIAVGASQMEASQRLILEARAGYALGTVDEIERYLERQLSGAAQEKLAFDEDVITRYHRRVLANKLLEIANR